MLILKIERWIVNALHQHLNNLNIPIYEPPYTVDVSRKNPLWRSSLNLMDDVD